MKTASVEEVIFYARMGEALCKIQILEQALNNSVTVKLNPDATQDDANVLLLKQQRYTFGKVVNIAATESLYHDKLQNKLDELLEERNWLVHQAMLDSQKGNRIIVTESVVKRIKYIAEESEKMQLLLEWDLIDFAQLQGRNMSKVIEIMIREKGERPDEF